MCHGIEGQDSQAECDVLKSQQGIGEGLSGKSTSGQGGHPSDATVLRVPRFRADGLCGLCITGKTQCCRGKWAQVSRPSDRFSDLQHR